MVVRNDLDRYHLAMDVIGRVPGLAARGANTHQALQDRLIEHQLYIARYGEDIPDIQKWVWPG
jgi:xylulose-5-phosphate/fructose-6-phosphate phosphoketolase